MNIEDIRSIVKDARIAGHDIRMKDIAYVIVRNSIDDGPMAYRCIFDTAVGDDEVKEYETQKSMKFLKGRMSNLLKGDLVLTKPAKNGKKYKDITFEENKEAMIELLDVIQEKMKSEEIEVKDGLKLMTDIRTRLNDKFAVSDKKDEHRIVVQAKFNHICEWTRKECFLQTKEYAMKQWGLVEPKTGKK